MNIFKVLASSRKSFPEEQASAMLAWLLNPSLEDGLGYVFFKKFCDRIGVDTSNYQLLRNKSTDTHVGVDLEYNVEYGFIDVVLFLKDNVIISIENKIYSQSVSNKTQLVTQYKGLKNKHPNDKIFMVFLVPAHSKKVDVVFNNLVVANSDTSQLVMWDDIREIIDEILTEESNGTIPPVAEYVKHTFKAFSNFIQEDFSGYYYERDDKRIGGMNPKAEGTKTFQDIKFDRKVKFVGVKDGIAGLLRLKPAEIQKKRFQYTADNMETNRNWIKKNTFANICDSIVNDNFTKIDWIDGIKLSAELIYYLANYTKKPFFVGIQGGKNALQTMSAELIREKRWGLSRSEHTGQWINKDIFKEIIKDKNVFN